MASPANMDRQTYWRKQLQRTVLLLVVWFIIGYGLSILLIEPLNGFALGGMPFGFWMAQQGSIYLFVLLILIYAISAGRLDREAGVEEVESADMDR